MPKTTFERNRFPTLIFMSFRFGYFETCSDPDRQSPWFV